MNTVFFYIGILLDETEEIKELARKTDFMAFVLLVVFIAAVLIYIIYLFLLHYRTKKPDRTTELLRDYLSATGNIVSVEDVKYYVDSNQKSNELENKNSEMPGALSKYDEKNGMEKTRYLVKYEFSIGNGDNLYSGEFYAYEKSENIQVGKTVEVKYNPSKPMVNFTLYSSQVKNKN